MGRRMVNTSTAARTKEAASATNAASRPKTAANAPPIAAPMASMAPQVEPNRAVAFFSSSSSRARFGTAACDAGTTNAPNAAMVAWARKASQTRPGPTPRRTDRGDGLDRRDAYDDPAAVEAVGGRARDRRDQEAGEGLAHEDQGHEQAGAREVLDQAEQRDVAEPVAHVRDDLGDEEGADVPVGPEHRQHGAAALLPVTGPPATGGRGRRGPSPAQAVIRSPRRQVEVLVRARGRCCPGRARR